MECEMCLGRGYYKLLTVKIPCHHCDGTGEVDH